MSLLAFIKSCEGEVDEMVSLTKIMIVAGWLWIIFWCLAVFFKDFQVPLALAGLAMLLLSATILLWTIRVKKRHEGKSMHGSSPRAEAGGPVTLDAILFH